ncbi:MAG: hypothetical protein KGH75_01375 [Rhodospirillales bacterium]|nr:hypothetical protein [Rhodospirillales bacterium]
MANISNSKVLKLIEVHGISKTAEILGINRTTLTRFKKKLEEGEDVVLNVTDDHLKIGIRDGLPLSEDQRKFHPEWTASDCINELLRVAKLDTTKFITRNHFRNYSDISESTWNRYFGSFLEFKRQAGIILSRQAHRLERDIAKHASVDTMRQLNVEKKEWEGKYLRPSKSRFQTVMVASDFHDISCDLFFYRLFLETLTRVQPEKIVLNGDIFDLPEFGKYSNDPRTWDVTGRVKWVHGLLADIRKAAPNSEIIFVEGNHEFRLLRHMSEQTQALLVILNELHGYTVPKLLGLQDYEVNYVARADMAVFSERDIKEQLSKNYITLYDNSLLFGHYPNMKNMGIPGANGHHHCHLIDSFYSPVYGTYEWHQLGCGHKRKASYTAGEKWSNGFLLVHIDTVTKRSQMEYIDCSHEHCMIGGKFYQRTKEEPVFDLIPSF